MALLESKDLALGMKNPGFKLKDPLGKEYSHDQAAGAKGLLVVFTCNHCPYALAVWPRLIKLAVHAKTQGINTVAINPNINPSYPEDSPSEMKDKITAWGIPFPYLIDGTQQVAKKFAAQCTPDIYLFDARDALVYHGRIDDNWQDEGRVTRQELKAAIDCLSQERPISPEQRHSIGCSIKWL